MRDSQADASAVVVRANENLAEYQHIRHWMIWSDADFPRTATGKPRIDAITQKIAKPDLRAKSGQGLDELIAKFSSKSAAETVGDFSQSARLKAILDLVRVRSRGVN